MINSTLLIKSLPLLLKASNYSLMITLGSFLIGIIGGLCIAIIRTYGYLFFSFLATIYVSVIRGTPVLIQIGFMFYVLPVLGISLNPLFCGILGLGICSSAYLSENIRILLLSVDRGQLEAAFILGLTRYQTARYIIIPYVLNKLVPNIINEFVTLSKDSSLVSTIGVVELYKTSQDIARQSYDYLTIMCTISIIYISWTGLITLLGMYIEKKIR